MTDQLTDQPTDQLRVWAPEATRVDVILAGERVALTPAPGGWWSGPVLAVGTDYALSVDGGPGRPDPRSRWQPHGVHAPSRWIAPAPLRVAEVAAFRPVPLRDAVIYELHIGTFSAEGTFAAAMAHLDALVELGVTHVELMPVAQFAGVHGWGYDGVDLFAAHAPYGGPDGLRALIAACHARRLGVLIDVVHNHFGPEGAYQCEFAPYKTATHMTPWGEAINLDGDGSREVRRFLIDSALGWLRDYGADGLRLDALHALRDDSARHFVAELVDEVGALARALGRPLVLIGEWDEHDPAAVRERASGGWGLDAHWNDDFHHALHALLTGETAGYYADFAGRDTLAKVLREGYALDGGRSGFRGGPHGQPFGALPRDRLVAYVQSHDQVGNRAAGERLHVLSGLARARIAAAILLTSPFVPMLFQGEEWAASTPFCYFVDLTSAELREAVRAGRRAEHAAAGWTRPSPDPTDPATRAASVLRWEERAVGPHAEMLAWYRELIALRRAHPNLRDPSPDSTQVEIVREDLALRIVRGAHALLVNLSPTALPLDAGALVTASAPLVDGALPPTSCALIARR